MFELDTKARGLQTQVTGLRVVGVIVLHTGAAM
jgi:hypothetical protein